MLSKKQKSVLFKEVGFEFNIADDEVLTYEKVFRAMEFGETFDNVCGKMDLVPSLVKDYLKTYVLHLIFEDAATFSKLEKELIREYWDEPLVNTTIGELFEQLQAELLFTESESFQFYLMGLVNSQKSIIDSSFKKEEESHVDSIYSFRERSYTLFPIYYNYFVNKKRPIKPQSLDNDNIDLKDFFRDLLVHFNQFKSLLKGYDNEVNPTRELLEFERETNIFFLLKVLSILPKEKMNEMSLKERKNYFKAIASVSIIEDIRLKLYFVEKLVVENNEFIFTKSQVGYERLFWLIYFYTPLLKEFFKEHIKAPMGALLVKETDEKDIATQLRRIKKKLFLCYILKDNPCYRVADLDSELAFKLDDFELHNYLDDLYKNVSKVRKFREKFCKETIERTLKEVNEKDGLPENIDYLFYQQAKSLVNKLALRIQSNKQLDEKSKIYSSFNMTEEKFMEKSKQIPF